MKVNENNAMRYEDNIVNKPWGYEYLVYKNDDVAIWFLYIRNGHATSLHCHPNKTTGLILLSGEVEIRFLSNTIQMASLSKTMIRRGLFHSTKALSKNGACIFEIETPVDKQDLVRLEDVYGREGQPYEDESHDVPKHSSTLWIQDPPSLSASYDYLFSECGISAKRIENIDELLSIDDDSIVIFLKGGIETEYNIHVIGRGDVVFPSVLKKILTVFNKISNETTVLIIRKHNG